MDETGSGRLDGEEVPGTKNDDGVPPAWALELASEIDDLRLQLAGLRRSLSNEVRTRRVVVEEADGFDRVVLEARSIFGGVEVRSRARLGEATAAGLFALDPGDGDPAQVGVSLSDRGNIVASLDVYSRHRPRLWTGEPPQTGA
jgi:hypothetical protein